MQREKKTRPADQSNGRAHRSNASLSQREWERKWNEEMGPAVIAMAVAMFAVLALGESGVIPWA